jgi:predicted SPOUT superfamily RNA methylase MTH1
VLSERKDGLLVDIGVQQPALLRQKQFEVGQRLTVQVVKVGEFVEVQPVSREDVPQYWGYTVKVEKRSFGQLSVDSQFDLKIATARIGDNFIDVANGVGERWLCSSGVLIAFGAPARGLHEIVADEGKKLPEVSDFIVNTVPNQGTATVRAEEALLATLAIFNVHFKY